MSQAVLVLTDGSVYYGKGFGSSKTAVGELVFNTSMVGYQEALTDPSYAGQVLIFTYPLQGNYGISKEDYESGRIQVRAFVVREVCDMPFHRKSVKTLDEFLKENDTPGISDLDTRSIVRKIRNFGVMGCALSTEIEDVNELLEMARKFNYDNERFVEQVSEKETLYSANGKKKVVLIDCGMKLSIIRELNKRGVDVVSVPYNASAKEIEKHSPDGICISNGPGNPSLLGETISTIKEIYESYPLLCICLGHQLLALAIGGKTYKLKFGHRSANQPVLDLENNKVIITTQNHGYAVDEKSLPHGWRAWQKNANDNSVEAIKHESLDIITLQYHPEANPGPYDARCFFDDYVKML